MENRKEKLEFFINVLKEINDGKIDIEFINTPKGKIITNMIQTDKSNINRINENKDETFYDCVVLTGVELINFDESPKLNLENANKIMNSGFELLYEYDDIQFVRFCSIVKTKKADINLYLGSRYVELYKRMYSVDESTDIN